MQKKTLIDRFMVEYPYEKETIQEKTNPQQNSRRPTPGTTGPGIGDRDANGPNK
jgi:hypothetical protein